MRSARTWLVLAVSASLVACGGGSDNVDEGPIPLTVPKAACGTNDKPETALQGQVPASLRTVGGFKGFSCNLELVGQSRGDGASWQHAWHEKCAYYDTSFATENRTHLGAVVLDLSNPAKPLPTAYLTTAAMLDPWESLKVHPGRKLLAASNGANGGGGPEIDVYDISGDCRFPQLLSSAAVGTGKDGGVVAPAIGHEGDFSPDGLTYYVGDLRNFQYFAVDVTSTVKPKLIATWRHPFADQRANTHGLSLSDDGNRAYFTSIITSGNVDFPSLANPAVVHKNGLMIADVSDIQQRRPNPQVRLISTLFWRDGAGAQHTIPVRIGGKPYLVFVDEGGAGGNTPTGWTTACAAGLPAWPMARLIDISDEANPKIVSRMMLETHDPKNCDKVLPDLAGLTSFTYGSHYCSVDDRKEATTLACGYFESGIRVFDIRNPLRPKEIAYYNPAAITTPSPGSQNNRTSAAGRPDHCTAQVNLDKANGMLWTTCQDNGFLALKFTNGVWPFK